VEPPVPGALDSHRACAEKLPDGSVAALAASRGRYPRLSRHVRLSSFRKMREEQPRRPAKGDNIALQRPTPRRAFSREVVDMSAAMRFSQ
jgi:hypothetical protein